MSDSQELTAALLAYITDLELNAADLLKDEPAGSPNTYLSEAISGCARDLVRILNGSLTAADLSVR
jgi:hypothetical protein